MRTPSPLPTHELDHDVDFQRAALEAVKALDALPPVAVTDQHMNAARPRKPKGK